MPAPSHVPHSTHGFSRNVVIDFQLAMYGSPLGDEHRKLMTRNDYGAPLPESSLGAGYVTTGDIPISLDATASKSKR
jgi:hypothetical protein